MNPPGHGGGSSSTEVRQQVAEGTQSPSISQTCPTSERREKSGSSEGGISDQIQKATPGGTGNREGWRWRGIAVGAGGRGQNEPIGTGSWTNRCKRAKIAAGYRAERKD